VLDFLQRALGVDPEWSVRSDRQLDWWPHTYRQTITSGLPLDDSGVTVTVLTCLIEILESVPESPQLYAAVSGVNQFAALSSLVYDPGAKTVASVSRIHIHPESSWLAYVIQAAAALQLHQVGLGPAWETQFGGKFVRSVHPTSGVRESPDQIVTAVESLFAPAGQSDSPFLGLMDILDRQPHPWSTLERTRNHIVAEVPFRDAIPRLQRVARAEPISTALLSVTAEAKHPVLGNGLALWLKLPFPAQDAGAHKVVNWLNLLEAQGATALQSLGSWCVAEEVMQYRMFVPAVLVHNRDVSWRTQLIQTLMQYMTARARAAHTIFQAAHDSEEAANRSQVSAARASQEPMDPESIARSLGIPKELGITAPFSTYARSLDTAMRIALKALQTAAPGLDEGSFMLELTALMLNATNESLQRSAVDTELRQAVMLKVVELNLVFVHGDPDGSNPEVLELKRWMYDELQQRERRWATAWQDLRADKSIVDQINPNKELSAFELYVGLMVSLFAIGLQENSGRLDNEILEAVQQIAGDAIMHVDPDKFASVIANGNRGALLSYAHTRMGRFL
jgi:hypothetical protein